MSVCVSVFTFVFTAPSYKQPFAIADSQKKLVEQIDEGHGYFTLEIFS